MIGQLDSLSVHCVMVPGSQINVLLPGVAIDEIVDNKKISHEPAGADWFVGFVEWRGVSVPVVSFDAMLGASVANSKKKGQRVLVLNPLPERGEASRLAILSEGNPKTVTIDDAAVEMELPTDLDIRFAVMGVNVKGRLAVIPDISALLDTFPTL